MASRAFVRFIETDLSLMEVLIMNENNNTTYLAKENSVTELKNRVFNSLILFVPGTDLLVTSVKLPTTNLQRQLQAIPYLLEDNLADEIEDLHFVVGSNTALPGQKAAAIVNKSKIDQWLRDYKISNVFIESMLPEFLALPYASTNWTIVVEKNKAYVRTGKLLGFSCTCENLTYLLTESLKQFTAFLPSSIDIYYFSSDFTLSEQAFNELNILVNHKKSDEPLITLMAKHYQDANSLNLLQGIYKQKPVVSINKPLWKIAGLLATTLFALIISNQLFYLYQLHQQENQLNQAIEKIYKTIFPQATALVAPETRVKQELQNLQMRESGDGFLGLLSKTGRVLKEFKPLHIEEMVFQNSQLTIQIKLNDFDSLQKLIQQLKSQNLTVISQNATSEENKINAQLLIKG